VLSDELLERAGERVLLGRALDEARAGQGRLIMLEGEAGIGKTALLELAMRLAAERGLRVLSARSAALEEGFGYGIVRQLFESTLLRAPPRRRAALLEGPAAHAGPVFGLAASGGGPPDPSDAAFAVQHGLYRLTATLAREAPLLLCIDDAHWADGASLRWIAYLARRLPELPACVIVARRLGEPSGHDALLDELRAAAGAGVVVPAPLSYGVTSALAAAVLGDEADPRLARACQEATGGNPLLLGELLRALAEHPEPAALSVQDVRRLGPQRVADEVIRRLRRLPPQALHLAQAISVLDVDAELRHAAAVAGLAPREAQAAADGLTLARLLAPGRPMQFVHPIMRAAVYAEVPPAQRAAAHRHAAEVLDAEPAGADRAAVHLLATEPAGDAWVIERLRAAADRALARGASDAAVGLLERARREPSDDPAVLHALGHAERLAGAPARAMEHLRAALDATSAPEAREAIARELATALAYEGEVEAAFAVLELALAAVPAGEPERRVRLEADFIVGMAHDDAVAATLTRAAHVAEGLAGRTPAERVLLGAAALQRARTASGTAAETMAMAQRAWADGQLLREHSADIFPFGSVAMALLLSDHDAAAERCIDAGMAEARARGSVAGLATASFLLARLHMHRGEPAAAEAAAREALREAGRDTHRFAFYELLGQLLRALTEQGRLDEADDVLASHQLDRRSPPPMGGAAPFLAARIGLRLAQTRQADAVADAEELLRRLERRGHRGLRLRMPVAEALLAAGGAGEARRLAEEEVERAASYGVPSALGVAQRMLGLTGGGDGLQHLQLAVDTLARTPCRLEYAKALAAFGAALRRANQRAQAREPLRHALELAHRVGAQLLVEHVRQELHATGARPRRLVLSGRDSLTPSEQRVAELVAQGLSNPEVAQRLFVARATVESHLRSVYRKLDVPSRHELATALLADGDDGESSGRLGDATSRGVG
jgi:DNA-binding CsgD family transcriptional regulator